MLEKHIHRKSSMINIRYDLQGFSKLVRHEDGSLPTQGICDCPCGKDTAVKKKDTRNDSHRLSNTDMYSSCLPRLLEHDIDTSNLGKLKKTKSKKSVSASVGQTYRHISLAVVLSTYQRSKGNTKTDTIHPRNRHAGSVDIEEFLLGNVAIQVFLRHG